MKKLITTGLIILLLPFGEAGRGFAQNWEWVELIQPYDGNAGMNVKVSSYDGNVYGGGSFNQSINLGNGHTVSGNADGFVTKFDTAGACQWAQRINVTTQGCGCAVEGNTSNASLVGIDSQGNLIVVGSFCGCGANFGSGITSTGGGYNLFLAKYSPAGVCLWVQTKPGSMNTSTGQTVDFFNTVTIDANDNIYVSIYNGANGTTFCGLNFVNQGSYFFKVNTNGVGIWNKQTLSTTNGYVIAGMQYSNKRIYAAANFLGTVSFGTTTLTSQGSLDLVTLKMDTAGNYLAAMDLGGSGGQTGALGLAISNNKIVVLGEAFTNTVSAGGTYTLNTGSGQDATFLAVYDTTSLSVQTATNTATDNNGSGVSLLNDTKGNMYLLAKNTATTGFGNLTGVAPGNHIIKMDNTLHNYWHLENTNACVAPDTLGNLYTVDVFTGSDTYGPFTETASGYGITLGKISNAYATGIENRMAQTNNMQVYPNPSNSLFNLKLSTTIKNSSSVAVYLYDVSGRMLNNIPYTKPDENTLQIDLTNYAEGNYLIKAQVDGVLYSTKLER